MTELEFLNKCYQSTEHATAEEIEALNKISAKIKAWDALKRELIIDYDYRKRRGGGYDAEPTFYSVTVLKTCDTTVVNAVADALKEDGMIL